jgi:tetratricopeptide (TPR) repeat protein
MKSTVSLQLIVKDEVDQVVKLVEKAYPFFDEVNLTVSDKPAANKLKKLLAIEANVKYREWNNNFADARNANFAMSTTDYTFWVDADDTFNFAAIPELVAIADEENIDAIYLPYNYAQDEQGNCVTLHWRERLVRNGLGFEWRGKVHETYITDEPVKTHMVDEPVKHNTSIEHAKASGERNHKILLEQVEGKTLEEIDPRDLLNLGSSFYTMGEYVKCLDALQKFIPLSGSDDDKYRARGFMSEAAYHLDNHEAAMNFASKAVMLIPQHPMAYWLLAQYEADQDNFEEALEWVRVSASKPDPQTLSVWDPTSRERAALIAARCEFMLGNFNAGLAWLRKYPNNPTARELMESFQEEADAETFCKLLPNIRKFFSSDKELWSALCHDMKYDKRLKALRDIATEPKTWSDKSIVIFCGQGYEEWGPHTLDKGMGGSEEAVVYLSRELAKLGYSVFVFSEVPKHIYKDGVDWYPWREIDTRDEFNIFVSWRAPQYLERVNAKVKLADIHDVLPPEIMKDYPDVTYMVKSAYHRSLTPDVPDDKFRIIGNGISKEQFKETK